jgi:hypothetical protein
MLGKHVDQSDFACLLGEAANHVLVGVSPPGDREGDLVPLGIWLARGKMQVTALRAVDLRRV